ncbi:MAG: hypothetical protein HY067_21275 [Betaproteobacteria bacterium]|nr:hypothetical protein [Betaproteobacteria bacterium]
MKRGSWINAFAANENSAQGLAPQAREEISKLDDALYTLWNLGDNVVIAWTFKGQELRFLSVRHYAIPEAIHADTPHREGMTDTVKFINGVLSGPKFLVPEMFDRVCSVFDARPEIINVNFRIEYDLDIELINSLVRRYSVSLVRGRAVVLLDAVEFTLRSPLDQMAMLNSLAYSVNSAYGQLLQKDIKINFARTTTGDGFYIWNRATTPEANIELYKLMMMVLADNAVAQRKARSSWVPKLRAAFHIGEHYEFHQVEGLNPTTFSYIVGQVTIDLSRMIERALPGQILLGDFRIEIIEEKTWRKIRYDTLDFVENTAATLDQLHGMNISGGSIDNIRCYLTGTSLGAGRYLVNRYHIVDKHGTTRTVYNAKINIHRENAEPIFLGIQSEDLQAFSTARVESLSRDGEQTGSFFVRP